MKSVNSAYIVWIENFTNPILKGQVADLLKELRVSFHVGKYFLIHFKPFYRFFFKSSKDERTLIKQLKAELKKSQITLVSIPVVFPGQWFSARWYQIPLIQLHAFPILLFFSIFKSVNIFHCRAYPATLPALMVKKITGAKVIFDPRSPFPEENITAGLWKEGSLSDKKWRNLEKTYLAHADATIAIAPSYSTHFLKIAPNANLYEIPNNVDLNVFEINIELRNSLRNKLGIGNDEIVFTYSGGLSNHWNNPRTYAEFIIKNREFDLKHRFLFITPFVDFLTNIFNEYKIDSNEYLAVSADFKEVPSYLSCADFGINLMSKPDIRISIKTVEYLAMKLPVIVNHNVIGASELIKKHNVGLIIDLEKPNLSELKYFINTKNKELSDRCRQVAFENYSTEKVAKKYSSVYHHFLNNIIQ